MTFPDFSGGVTFHICAGLLVVPDSVAISFPELTR